ncbi:methyl-accepting chemotaxis protein [Moritella sp. F3]|uniref:methyl-accepting chemotaxis protein n=1 Tax=Moritella sp. F3 TaxID=2718882 RepID=UPI0018E1BA14|nr:methyl-accepting chemotaxis protein [Moritella sp. F3]GIC78380.1 methyl-accepting chemotaxis protein [Moritella sp. F1]GIC83687.1 methyl-accepting chemotaxis protein [Moritella sp. F3]
MGTLLQPITYLISRLSFQKKFGLVILLLTTPIVFFSSTIISQTQKDIAFAESELQGYELLQALPEVANKLIEYRHLLSLEVAELGPGDENIAQAQTLAENTFNQYYRAYTAATGSQLSAFDKITTDWQQLKADSDFLLPEEIFYAVDLMLENLRIGTREINSESKLLFDSHLSSYYLINLTQTQLPRLLDFTYQVTDKAAETAAFATFTATSFDDLSRRIDQLNIIFSATNNDVQALLAINSNYNNILTPPLNQIKTTMATLDDLLDRQLINTVSAEIKIDPNTLYRLGDELQVNITRLYEVAFNTLGNEITVRLNEKNNELNVFYAILIILFVVCVVILLSIYISLTETIRSISRVAQNVSNGDLSENVKIISRDELAIIAQHFNSTIDGMRTLVKQLNSSAVDVHSSVQDITDKTNSAETTITAQQTETHQIAAAIKLMATTSTDMAVNASDATGATHDAERAVLEGKQVVDQTIIAINAIASEVETSSQTIQKLESHCADIGGVVEVIRSIADQTNLLALNAAIEAARAGEQGRGFAVVADEVRTLASRTQQSTNEIQVMIERVQSGAKESVKVMAVGREQANMGVMQAKEASNTFEAITLSVDKIVAINDQIASAIEEQSLAAAEIERNVSNVSAGADSARSVATGATQSAHNLLSVADKLTEVAEEYAF